MVVALEKLIIKMMSLPSAVVLCLFAVLLSLLAGQLHIISTQHHQIDELLVENAELRNNLADTEEKINTLLETQADIKAYQQELDRWFKGVSFGSIKKIGKLLSSKDGKQAQTVSLIQQGQPASSLRLAKLELAAERAKYDVTSLLGEAQTIRDFMQKIPSLVPAHGPITSHFGRRVDPFNKQIKQHNGIDIAARLGDPVYAPAVGKVKKIEYSPSYGNMIEIEHEHGFVTLYGHLQSFKVKKGQKIARGQQIATVGNSGSRCNGTHLHYEVHQNNAQLNPIHFMADASPKDDII